MRLIFRLCSPYIVSQHNACDVFELKGCVLSTVNSVKAFYKKFCKVLILVSLLGTIGVNGVVPNNPT